MNILNILLYLLVELYCVFCVIYCYSNSTDRSLKENFSIKKIGVLVAGDILFFINNIWSPTEIRTLCSLIIMCSINKHIHLCRNWYYFRIVIYSDFIV